MENSPKIAGTARPLRTGMTIAFAALLVAAHEPAPIAGDSHVILALDPRVDVAHEEDFFNRRTVLTFTYWTGIGAEERCSEVDPENVTLVVEIPDGTEFVEAEREGEPLTPSEVEGGTVTWELGTLDRSADCWGTDVAVTLEADLEVPDAEELEAAASIATSTSGDDPSDNETTVTFPAVMFPVHVVVDQNDTECYSELFDSRNEADDGQDVHCGTGQVASAAAAWPRRASWGDTIASLGASGFLPGAIPDVVESSSDPLRGRISVSGRVILQEGDDVDAVVRQDLDIHNPNPFPVPLHVHRDMVLTCSVHDGSASVVDGEYAECGHGPIDRMSETVHTHFRARGGGGQWEASCEEWVTLRSGEREDRTSEDVDASCSEQQVDRTEGLDFELSGSAYLRTDDDIASFNARQRWCITLSRWACEFGMKALSIQIDGPVDLLVTDAEARRIGVLQDPDAGPLPVADIPGSSYSDGQDGMREIILGLPDPDAYALEIAGRDEGDYTLTIRSLDEEDRVISEHTISGRASGETILEQTLLLAVDGRLALEVEVDLADLTEQLLGGADVLDAAHLDYLDLLGNANGRLDVGDFRAYLISTGEDSP